MVERVGTIIVTAGALVLASCGQKTESEHNVTTTTTVNDTVAAPIAVASPGQIFANNAAASDAFEVASSNLAATKAHSAAVKAFAKQMVKAHTESTAKLKTAAAAASPAIAPDPALTPDQQQSLDALNALDGAPFDTAYAAAQTQAHEKTLAALKDYAATGDVPSLKSFAAGLVPTVTAHLNMAKSLKP
jgi:putative membrane protein